MKNPTARDFRNKFRLLNSQENSADNIIWSCSDSSDYENYNEKLNFGKANQTGNRKRKRGKNRKESLKNISNLNITFIETPLEGKIKSINRSPVLPSPILRDSRPKNIKEVSSPILHCNNKSSETRNMKSPILFLNNSSPKISPNVKKKLFTNNINIANKPTKVDDARSKSPVFISSGDVKKSKGSKPSNKNVATKNIVYISDVNIKQEIIDSDNTSQELSEKYEKFVLSKRTNEEREIGQEWNSNTNHSSHPKSVSVALIEKVKSYFDSHFSSETPSQQSISECDTTPKDSSKTSEEIEIINSQADKCLPQVIKLENRSSVSSLRSFDFEMEKRKKIRYKKDGLAHRLSVLLKKQKANTCLWQHERFLAANSNFVVPREEFIAFRVQNVTYNYGCYVLEVTDVEEKKFVILINHSYVNNCNIEKCNIFKLYRPFRILDLNEECKLIVNVSKFETTALNS